MIFKTSLMDVDVMPTQGQCSLWVFFALFVAEGEMLFSRFYMAIWTKIHFTL